MNKGQLVDEVAVLLGKSKAEAGRVTAAIFKTLTAGMKRDKAVTISGFGTFTMKVRRARTVRNPATGEPLHIKPSRTVNFKPSQRLKDAIQEIGESPKSRPAAPVHAGAAGRTW